MAETSKSGPEHLHTLYTFSSLVDSLLPKDNPFLSTYLYLLHSYGIHSVR